MEKQRLIVDYKNITPEQLQILTDKYPEGFDPDDMIVYKNSEGKTVRTIPLETETTKYLFKVSIELERRAQAFLDDEDDQEEVADEDAAPEADAAGTATPKLRPSARPRLAARTWRLMDFAVATTQLICSVLSAAPINSV